MKELEKRLKEINDSYFDFVSGILNYAKKKPERKMALKKYLEEHPDATSSDVVEFVSNQPDFFEDSACPKMQFLIQGKDYEYLKRFRKNHKKCFKGTSFDQFSYSFIPTSLGTAITVECSCGKKLLLGDFLDSTDEYREVDAEDKDNHQFEEAARRILFLKDPRMFLIGFHKEQNFETIYSYAVGVAAFADKRISKCILWEIYRDDETGSLTKNYTGDDAKNIELFYSYFEQRLKEELSKYNCKDEKFNELLN